MVQGVEIESHVRQEIMDEIIEHMHSGYATSFTMAIQKLNATAPRVSERECYRWRKEFPEFDKRVIEAREFGWDKAVDLAENRTVRIIQNTKLRAHDRMVRYVLDRKGGKRGWSPKIIALPPNAPQFRDAEIMSNEEMQEAMAELRQQS